MRSAECGVRSAECGVRSAENAECGKCGVWKMRSVEYAECGICGVWNMRSVENEECGKCGVWKMYTDMIFKLRPRSTSCETYQHSANVKEHKAKITHSIYRINSILRRSLQK